MRRASLVLLVLLVIIGAVYYCFWRWQADNILAQTKIALANMSSGQNGVVVKVEHQGMEIGGFPFSHELVLHSPVISGSYTTADVEAMLAQTADKKEGDVAPKVEPSGLVHRFSVKLGEARVGINYFTTRGEVSFRGEASGESSVGESKIGWKFEKPADGLRCDTDFAPSSLPYFLKTIMKRQAIAWKDVSPYLRAARCHFPAQRAVATDNGEWLMSNQESHLDFDQILLDEKQIRFHLDADFPGSEIADRYQRLLGENGDGKPGQVLPLKQFENVGTQAWKLETTVAMDQPAGGLAGGAPEPASPLPPMFDIDVKRFSYHDKMMTADLTLLFKLNEQEKDHTNLDLKYDATYKFTPAFDKAAQDSLRMVLAEPSTGAMLGLPEEASGLDASLVDAASDAIPKMSGFGTIHFEIDMAGQMAGNPVGGAVKTSFNTKKLRFSADPYSLGAAGSMAGSEQPEGFASIDSQHYPKLIADAVGYNNRVQRVLSALDPSRQAFNVTPAMVEAVTSFLQGLNLSKEPDTLNISVAADGKGGITISNQPYLTVMISAMQKLGPILAEVQGGGSVEEAPQKSTDGAADMPDEEPAAEVPAAEEPIGEAPAGEAPSGEAPAAQ